MARYKKLPRRGTWEVGLFQPPEMSDSSDEVVGILFVVEARGGLLRAATPVGPGGDLEAHLLDATRGGPGVPRGRPKTIRCLPGMLHELDSAAALLGCRLVPAESLPVAEDALMALLESLTADEEPELQLEDPEPWVPVVRELVKASPWEHIHDQLAFVFQGPEALDGWIGLVLGQAGQQRGLVFYPDYDALQGLPEMAETGRLPADFFCTCVHLDPIDEVGPEHLAWAQEAGLVVDGLVLRTFSMDDEGVLPFDEEESREWLEATRAVLAVWARHGEQLLDGEERITLIASSLGDLNVRTTDVASLAPEPLVPEEHLLWFDVGLGAPRLCIKAAKADAERIAGRMDKVECVVIDVVHGTIEVTAGMEDGKDATIGVHPWDPGLLDALGSELELVVMKGGAKRRSARTTDELYGRIVPIDLVASSLPLVDPSWRASADYSGPTKSWPPASTVLIAFGESSGLNTMSIEALEQELQELIRVWNSVVLADVAGDAITLGLLRGDMDLSGRGAWLDHLIALKREAFAEDTRLMMLQGVEWRGDEAYVQVVWSDARERGR